jgi:hypothetical protein
MQIFSAFKTHIATAIPTLSGRVFPTNSVVGYDAPYCTYELSYSRKLQTLQGYAGETEFDYQFNFWNVSFDTAKANAEAFWDYINPYRGAFGDCYLEEVEYIGETESSDLAASKVRFNAILELRFKCIKI